MCTKLMKQAYVCDRLEEVGKYATPLRHMHSRNKILFYRTVDFVFLLFSQNVVQNPSMCSKQHSVLRSPTVVICVHNRPNRCV